MSNTEVSELERCVDAINLGSPTPDEAPSPLPTVRKIKIKLKPAPPSPLQSEDASSEASLPIFEIDSAKEKITKSALVPSAATTGFNKPVSTEEESIIGSIIRAIFQTDESSDLPPQSQWVRPINFNGQIRWIDYDKKSYFKRVAWIIPDLEVVEEPSKSAKKRKKKLFCKTTRRQTTWRKKKANFNTVCQYNSG